MLRSSSRRWEEGKYFLDEKAGEQYNRSTCETYHHDIPRENSHETTT